MSAARLAVGLLLVSSAAAGEPGFWARPSDPSEARRERATEAAERMLWRADQSYGVATMERDFTRAAAAVAGLGGAVDTEDGTAAYLLGRALSSHWARDRSAARSLLDAALSQEPTASFAGDGWFRLGIVTACGGDLTAATRDYARALELIWEPSARSEALLELAETLLADGESSDAAAKFGATAHSALKVRVEALAYFGLASALERMGQPSSALQAARAARATILPRLYYGSDDVLTMPSLGCALNDAERQFRRALGATAVALDMQDVDGRVGYLQEAIGAWEAYLGQAADGAGRARAETRRAQCRVELGKALSELEPASLSPRNAQR